LVVGSTELLGGRIGQLDDAATRDWLSQRFSSFQLFVARIAHPDMPPQLALALLRRVAYAASHMCSVVPPDVLWPLLALLDRLVLGPPPACYSLDRCHSFLRLRWFR